MCGITARAGESEVVAELLRGLDTLACRGYDAAGAARRRDGTVDVHGCAGRPTDLEAVLDSGESDRVAIGQTCWSSRDVPDGARPPTDCTGEIAVVVDGTVENRAELFAELRARGHDVESERAIVPHLVEASIEAGDPPDEAFRSAVRRLEGAHSAVMIVADREAVYAARSGTPLFLGVADDGYVLASAVPAFLAHTDTLVALEDGDVAVVTPSTHAVTDLDGRLTVRPPERVGWTQREDPDAPTP